MRKMGGRRRRRRRMRRSLSYRRRMMSTMGTRRRRRMRPRMVVDLLFAIAINSSANVLHTAVMIFLVILK